MENLEKQSTREERKKKKIPPLRVIYACLVYIFLYLPIAVVVAFSFNTSEMNIVFEGFTL